MNDIIIDDTKAREFFKDHPQVREGSEISVKDWECIFGEFLVEGGTMRELEGIWRKRESEKKADAADHKLSETQHHEPHRTDRPSTAGINESDKQIQ